MKAMIMLISSIMIDGESLNRTIDSTEVPSLLTKYIDTIETRVLEVSNFAGIHELNRYLHNKETCMEIANSINSIVRDVSVY